MTDEKVNALPKGKNRKFLFRPCRAFRLHRNTPSVPLFLLARQTVGCIAMFVLAFPGSPFGLPSLAAG